VAGGQLVCRPFLSAAYFRQFGDGRGRQRCRASALAVDGWQALSVHHPIGILAVLFGLWLWFGFGFSGGWLHAKTVLVVGLLGYHAYCGRLLRDFQAGRNVHGHVWFRWFNEMPVLVLLAVTYLAVVKPF
jgi:uncharacterized membrane protein